MSEYVKDGNVIWVDFAKARKKRDEATANTTSVEPHFFTLQDRLDYYANSVIDYTEPFFLSDALNMRADMDLTIKKIQDSTPEVREVPWSDHDI